MEIISAVFAGSVISVRFGKVSTISPFQLEIIKAGPWLNLPWEAGGGADRCRRVEQSGKNYF
jgi:hypothetical protein